MATLTFNHTERPTNATTPKTTHRTYEADAGYENAAFTFNHIIVHCLKHFLYLITFFYNKTISLYNIVP